MEFFVSDVRKVKGLTQSELSKKSGVSVSTISKMENGKMSDRMLGITLLKIANALNVRVGLIINESKLKYPVDVEKVLQELKAEDPQISDNIIDITRTLLEFGNEETDDYSRNVFLGWYKNYLRTLLTKRRSASNNAAEMQ